MSCSRFIFCGFCMATLVLPPACHREENKQKQIPPNSPTPPAHTAASQSALLIPDDPQSIAANNRGVGLMGKFQYEDARAIFQQLVDQHPNWIDAKVNLAISILNRQREGDDETALKLLDDVLKDQPQHLRAHYCSALLRLFLESPDEALPHFQLVAETDPNDPYAAYYVGQCLAQSHRYAEAVDWFERAVGKDSYLRSGYYAASQALRALHRDDEAKAKLAEFTRLEKNPRAHLVQFKYTRMGPKSQALAVNAPPLGAVAKLPRPEGPIFADPAPLLDDGEKCTWKLRRADRPVSITACDINGDGLIDIFIADVLDEAGGARNAVCINQGDGHFKLDGDHVLAMVPDVNAALWGDYDNDGLTDVYLCRRGPNMLWRQVEKNKWQDVTAATATADGQFDTVDGAIFDADHDGDLDIFCVNADGPNELLNNNLDGTFRPIAKEKGIADSGKGSRQVLPVDLDGDGDLDIVVINNEPPHGVWINDRLWQYHPAEGPGFDRLETDEWRSLAAGDADADGQIELYARRSDARLKWEADEMKRWGPRTIALREPPTAQSRLLTWPLCLTDCIGDGSIQSLGQYGEGWSLERLDGGPDMFLYVAQQPVAGLALAQLSASAGPAVVAMPTHGPPLIWLPGPGRYPFAALTFTGRKEGESIRSNASGIGTRFAARFDSNWVAGDTLRNSSGPGQSLQPVAIGLGGQAQIDFVSIDWSDGVFQSEVDLKSGELHQIVETQRQVSSCPVIFAWNGTKYEFIADVLGVGGIGYATGPGQYAPSRPWERLQLPANLLQPKNGRYIIKIGEPMEEACYLDAVRLVAYDLPPLWSMTLDERMGVQGPEPTGEPRFYQRELLPSKAINDRGEDVTASILSADLRAAPVGEVDSRFIGRLQRDHVLTLTFDQPINPEHESGAPGGGEPLLIADGWIEYPYSQTMFAAWQAGAEYRAPTIEARSADGQWHTMLEQFGYPAGMPRRMTVALPLDKLPTRTMQLRISTNQEIYWDRLAIALAEPCPRAIRHELKMREARLIQSGFAKRTTGPQRQPYYDYDQRAPFWDTRYQRGLYTAIGPVEELIARADDALAIFGPGEEIHVEFEADSTGDIMGPGAGAGAGWSRVFVLETDGWCKDMDLYTKDGDTLEPLPSRTSGAPDPHRDQLHRRFNTRFESGK